VHVVLGGPAQHPAGLGGDGVGDDRLDLPGPLHAGIGGRLPRLDASRLESPKAEWAHIRGHGLPVLFVFVYIIDVLGDVELVGYGLEEGGRFATVQRGAAELLPMRAIFDGERDRRMNGGHGKPFSTYSISIVFQARRVRSQDVRTRGAGIWFMVSIWVRRTSGTKPIGVAWGRSDRAIGRARVQDARTGAGEPATDVSQTGKGKSDRNLWGTGDGAKR